jgi:hypothetical protein
MLSDDPLARPAPAALANLDGIHARRGGQRIAMRAARPIAIGDQLAWNRRILALRCSEKPQEAMELLRRGAIEQWLRRSAEDGAIAGGIEELRRDQSLDDGRAASRRRPDAGSGVGVSFDDFCLLRLVALLDPLAPLFWRGFWLWPDGLGPLLAGALATPPTLDASQASALFGQLHRGGALGGGALARWRQTRPTRPQHEESAIPARLLRRMEQDDARAIFLRATYALNPYLPCAAAALAADTAVTPVAVAVALERLAGATAGKPLLDEQTFAFLDARLDEAPGDAADAGDADPAIRELRVLSRCQALRGCGPMPGIAASLLPRLEPGLRDWPGQSRRERRAEQLKALAAKGELASMLRLVTDSASREADEAAREAAVIQAADISAALVDLAETLPRRLQASRIAARDTASATGMLCVMAVLLYELLSR